MKQIVHMIYEIFDKCHLKNNVIIVYVIVLFLSFRYCNTIKYNVSIFTIGILFTILYIFIYTYNILCMCM